MFAIFEPNPSLVAPTSGGDQSVPHKPEEKPNRRREKPQLSCNNCRQKKLKCDRLKPCDNCAKRRQSCDYTIRPIQRAARRKTTSDVHDRVQQLEDMIKTLINNQTTQSANAVPEEKPTSFANSSAANDGGFAPAVSLSPSASVGKFTRTNFVGSEHWESILEDIAELKLDMETPEMPEDQTEEAEFKPHLLFGTERPSRAEIIASIPSREVCDMLISRWFKTFSMASLVVHVPTFMKEYNEMLKDPDETPLMWFGLLFAILGLASFFYGVTGEGSLPIPEPWNSMWEMSSHFRERAAQCLVEVNYLRPKRYTVEALCFYIALEKFPSRDHEFGSYVLLGIAIRIAMRMGYHRDASHYPNISPFDGEMRRRVWSMIFQLDLATSAQIGLPRMIRQEETDTCEPKNLLDTDFDEDIVELPHPRPTTDVTPVAYAIFMVRILRELGRIVDHSNCTLPPPYSEVMRLDSELLKTHSTMPSYLAMRPLSESLTDDADLILRRCALEVYFQKSRCVLHRKYLIPGKLNPQFRYSRASSLDAAMKLLVVQSMFFYAVQPGGQLYGEQWRTSALINQDYILAAMILLLDLASTTAAEANVTSESEREIEATWPRSARLHSVKGSYEIWSKLTSQAASAARAADTLKGMLRKVDSNGFVSTATNSNSSVSSEAGSVPQKLPLDGQQYMEPPSDIDFKPQDLVGSFGTDLFEGTTEAELNFDWELWDSQWNSVPYNTELPTEL